MRKTRSLPMAVALGALIPVLIAGAPPRPELRKQCGAGAMFRKADLPPQALAALDFRMADSNEPFQSTDAIPAGPRLPFRRLICAEPIPGGYLVRFEHGGIGYRIETMRLSRQAHGSFVAESASPRE